MATPAWAAPVNVSPTQSPPATTSNWVQQFLGTHGITAVYEGSPIVLANTQFVAAMSLFGYTYDQPFAMSGTELDRLTLPLLALGNGADVTVALYADSGGVPTGAALATTVIPAEFLLAAQARAGQRDAFPVFASPGGVLVRTTSTAAAGAPTDPNVVQTIPGVLASALATPFPSYYVMAAGFGQAVALGVNWGGSTNGYMPNTVYSAPLQQGGLGVWTAQGQFPTPIDNPAMCVTSTGHCVVSGGLVPTSLGSTSFMPSTATYFATVGADGTVSSWQTGPAWPSPTSGAGPAFLASAGNVIWGAFENASTDPPGMIMYSAISNGQMSPWTAVASIPTYSNYNGYGITVCNGWLIAAMWATVFGTIPTPVWGARLAVDGNGNPTGALATGWIPFPSIPPNGGYSNTDPVLITCGNTVLTIVDSSTGSNISQLVISPEGPAEAWGSVMQTGWAFLGTTGAGAVIAPGSPDTLVAPAAFALPQYEFPLLSAPLRATGLSNGATYHVVISSPARTPNDAPAVALINRVINTGAGGNLPQGHYRQGAGAWTALPAEATCLNLYSGTSGRIVHTLEDVTSGAPARWTWQCWDYWGKPIGYGEMTGNTREFSTLGYDTNGALTTIS